MGLCLRSRLESIVRHASKKANLTCHGAPRRSPFASSSTTAPTSSSLDTISGITSSSATSSQLLTRPNKDRHHVLTRNPNAAVWLSYEAALTAFSPNRGQFLTLLKDVRRRQKAFQSAVKRDVKYLKMISDASKKRWKRRSSPVIR